MKGYDQKAPEGYHWAGSDADGFDLEPNQRADNTRIAGGGILDIQTIFDTSLSRSRRWHGGGLEDWSPLEWAGAMAGEAGEAANAAKKLKRIEGDMATVNEPGRHYETAEAARKQVAREAADTILYGLLLMARVGVDAPGDVLREVFNKKSEEYGFPERI